MQSMLSVHKKIKLKIENRYLLNYHKIFVDKVIYLNNTYIKIRILRKIYNSLTYIKIKCNWFNINIISLKYIKLM